MVLLQEAIAAGTFLLIGLFAGLISIFLIVFLGSKVRKLRTIIRELKNGDDDKQLKEKRTEYVFWLSIMLFLTIGLVAMIIKFSNAKFD